MRVGGTGRWPTLGVRELPSGAPPEGRRERRAARGARCASGGAVGRKRAGRGPRPAGLTGEVDGERGFMLARRLSGERALPVGRAVLVSPGTRLCRHVLVCGATGSGKTETVLRLAWTVAKHSDAPVFYLDGKGDRENAERFCGLMADAGRETRVFPNEPFDGWRGQAHEIHGRLMEIIDYSSDGPGIVVPGYRQERRCDSCASIPTGHRAPQRGALERMDLGALRGAHPGLSACARSRGAGQPGPVALRGVLRADPRRA